jgi:hypothetical protein
MAWPSPNADSCTSSSDADHARREHLRWDAQVPRDPGRRCGREHAPADRERALCDPGRSRLGCRAVRFGARERIPVTRQRIVSCWILDPGDRRRRDHNVRSAQSVMQERRGHKDRSGLLVRSVRLARPVQWVRPVQLVRWGCSERRVRSVQWGRSARRARRARSVRLERRARSARPSTAGSARP